IGVSFLMRLCVLLYLVPHHHRLVAVFFFFNDTATTEIYTLSLHDALPIYVDEELVGWCHRLHWRRADDSGRCRQPGVVRNLFHRSEEHTSELQSLTNLVCRLLLEKKKKNLPRLTSPQSIEPPKCD